MLDAGACIAYDDLILCPWVWKKGNVSAKTTLWFTLFWVIVQLSTRSDGLEREVKSCRCISIQLCHP